MKFYEYRVIAINAGGESKPSDSSGSIQARPMAEAPKYVPANNMSIRLNVIIEYLMST